MDSHGTSRGSWLGSTGGGQSTGRSCRLCGNRKRPAGRLDRAGEGGAYLCLLSQTSADAGFLARHVGLKCGVQVGTPALTVNRLCGSGFQSIVNAAHVSALSSLSLSHRNQ